MKCPSCKRNMQVDSEKNRYVCECGKVIEWMKKAVEVII